MTINARRFAYDTDGTMIGYREDNAYEAGVTTWYNQEQLTLANLLMPSITTITNTHSLFVVFPESRNITSINAFVNAWNAMNRQYDNFQYSVDTTNGTDGTWVTLGISEGTVSTKGIPQNGACTRYPTIAIPVPVKGFRMKIVNGAYSGISLYGLVIYGSKATPDDLRLTDVAGTEFTALHDLGNKTAGSSTVETVYVKNANATYGASGVTVKVEGTRYTTSLDNVTFDATDKVIGSLASGAISAPVYVKFAPVEGDTLGFNAGRILVDGTFIA
jgi:hypothetical protein